MVPTPNSTTIHGSYPLHITTGQRCATCGAPVAAVRLPGGDLACECQNPRCGRTVALKLREVK